MELQVVVLRHDVHPTGRALHSQQLVLRRPVLVDHSTAECRQDGLLLVGVQDFRRAPSDFRLQQGPPTWSLEDKPGKVRQPRRRSAEGVRPEPDKGPVDPRQAIR